MNFSWRGQRLTPFYDYRGAETAGAEELDALEAVEPGGRLLWRLDSCWRSGGILRTVNITDFLIKRRKRQKKRRQESILYIMLTKQKKKEKIFDGSEYFNIRILALV